GHDEGLADLDDARLCRRMNVGRVLREQIRRQDEQRDAENEQEEPFHLSALPRNLRPTLRFFASCCWKVGADSSMSSIRSSWFTLGGGCSGVGPASFGSGFG